MERLLTAENISGTAPAADDVEIIQPRSSRATLIMRIAIQCTDGTNDLQLSLDGGRGWWTIATGTSFAEDVRAHEVLVRGSGGTSTYEAILFTG